MPRNTTKAQEVAPKYAGIDYHKKFFVVTLGDAAGNMLCQEKLSSDQESVQRFFRNRGKLVCAIENCRGNEWFIESLKACGCEVRVANTYAVRLIAESRCKNDKIDSRILMELVSRNYLPVCYQPTEEERLLRERLRFRTKLMRSRTQYKNVAHALMDKENKGRAISTKKGRKVAYKQGGLHPERQERLQESLEIIDYLDRLVDDQDKDLIAIAEHSEAAQRLKTIPGVGTLSALLLVAELGDISRFRRAKNVGSYLGLVPRLYASSDVSRMGRITKQGSGLVRRILVQDAWMAISRSSAFRNRYNNILKRRGKRVAIVAIARMIAEVAYRILRDQTEFREELLTLG
ncbi:MAG: IS110 family transposase [Planctomycetes bacterium]|uniref:IS110 family transposase n=1 Tax=Candidatus Obscuribacter phosphatis TaxID=1906157 RepID=A0A8J7PLU0_9BACT|nr:IS110 family transposase [Planctomycetota bacterium]MBN8662928.1 IS110 family transposase [Candidatus Obscuribacter phosphatis]